MHVELVSGRGKGETVWEREQINARKRFQALRIMLTIVLEYRQQGTAHLRRLGT